tara:strand:+ start:189 stop:347 length:159 start_codon:yes stop_codon:yes gene_type:complete
MDIKSLQAAKDTALAIYEQDGTDAAWANVKSATYKLEQALLEKYYGGMREYF